VVSPRLPGGAVGRSAPYARALGAGRATKREAGIVRIVGRGEIASALGGLLIGRCSRASRAGRCGMRVGAGVGELVEGRAVLAIGSKSVRRMVVYAPGLLDPLASRRPRAR